MTVFTKFWVADHEYASHFALSHQVISQFKFGSNRGMDGDLHSGVYRTCNSASTNSTD